MARARVRLYGMRIALLLGLAVLSRVAIAGEAKKGPITPEELEKIVASTKRGTETEVRPGIYLTVHRVQTKAPIRGGWHRASATGGKFTAELPVTFSDFMMRTKATDGVEVRVDVLAGNTGTVTWTVSCARRKDGTAGPNGAAFPEKTESVGDPVRGWVRTQQVDGRLCSLTVATKGTDPLPRDADIKRFLASLKAAGKPTW